MHFDFLFRRSVGRSGGALLVARSSDRDSFVEQQARSRGQFFRPGDQVGMRATISTLSYQRSMKFQKAFACKRAACGSGAFMGDFSQNIEAGRRCGEVLPAVTTSSTMYSFSQAAIFTPEDIWFSRGWPSSQDSSLESSCRAIARC